MRQSTPSRVVDEDRPEPKQIVIYTDGACLGNPGPGGYGVVILCDNQRKELSGGFRLTTNNRMEIMAAIVGLRELKDSCSVTLYTDSQYLSNAMSKGWAKRWRANGWMRNNKEKALNPDLWEQLLGLCDRHVVRFVWVRGHAGNRENERCDQLSWQAARQRGLPHDPGYEGPAQRGLSLR
ncbi:MAG: ribonuclease HI [Chloroflexota bacterium]|nr:MAG: ribonuclease HI [Chloroflexota bacterium]